MTHKYVYLEPAALIIAALALLVTAAFSLHLDLLNAVYHSSLWETRNDILRYLIYIYGVALLIASIASFLMIRYRKRSLLALCFTFAYSVQQEVNATWKWSLNTGQMRNTAVWIAPIIVVGAVVRGFFLAQPMRYDEAYTFLKFVNGGLYNLFYYPLPNNHILHTLLVRFSVGVFGKHPFAIRLPAVLAGLLTIPLTFWISRILSGKSKSGFFAAALVAAFPYLILYDTMARGYSLLVLLSLCLVGLGLRLIVDPSMRLSSLIALVAALGIFNIPTFLFPTVGVFCWVTVMLLQRGRRPIWVITHVLTPCALMTGLLTGLFYTPVAIANNGIDSVLNNQFVTGLPWREFLSRLPAHISSTAIQFTRDLPTLVLVLSLSLLVGGMFTYARERRWISFMLFPVVAIGGAVPLFVKHAIPFARTWIYLLPLVFILMDAGLTAIAKLPNVYVWFISLFIAGCSAVVIMNYNLISSYPDTGHFPEAPVLVDVLANEMTPADKIVSKVIPSEPMLFYMWYKGVPRERSTSDGHIAPREFIVVKPSRYSLSDVTNRPARRLFKIGDAELYVTEINQDP